MVIYAPTIKSEFIVSTTVFEIMPSLFLFNNNLPVMVFCEIVWGSFFVRRLNNIDKSVRFVCGDGVFVVKYVGEAVGGFVEVVCERVE